MGERDAREVGLCAGCRHARIVATPRSEFWLCERSRTDSTYERYPRLPRLECRGYEPGSPLPAGPPGGLPDGDTAN